MGDYFGSNGYLTGLGFRKKGPRPVNISKSMQLLEDLDEDEYYIDEYGKRHRKKDITELRNLEISEISLVDQPACKKWSVIKNLEGLEGDDKEVDRCEWSQAQRIIFGFNEDDLDMLENSDIEISKSSEDEKWPSLSGQFERNKQRLEKQYEEYELESRLV